MIKINIDYHMEKIGIGCQKLINAFTHRRENDTRKNKLINFNIVADIPLAYRVHEAEVKHS